MSLIHAVWRYRGGIVSGDSSDGFIGGAAPHGVSIIFVNPDYLELALAQMANKRLGRRQGRSRCPGAFLRKNPGSPDSCPEMARPGFATSFRLRAALQ